MEFLHHVVETLVGSISIALNLALLYLIGYHSNFSAPVYQVMLAVDASLDLTLSAISLVAQPICFTGGGYHVVVSNGFFAGWSYRFDEFMMWMWLNVSLFNVVWIVIQFVYRYTFICLREPHRASEKRRTYWFLCAFCVVTCATGVSLNYIYCHTEVGLEALEMNHWNTSQTPVVIGTHADQWLFTEWIVFWTIACTISMVVVALFEVKIKRHLSAMGNATHDATRKMHKEFHRALLAMAICPLITTSPPILFFMAAAYFR